MRTHLTTLIGGVLIGMATLAVGIGLVGKQESTAAAADAPGDDRAVMMQMATPAVADAEMTEQMQQMMAMMATPGAGDPQTATKMNQMMDQCMAMMQMMAMMMGMMGGDMSGMEGMEGMEEMPAMSATPGA